MRKVIGINNGWYYNPEYVCGLEEKNDVLGFMKVNLPHTNIEVPYNYFDERMYQFQSCYEYPLSIAKKYEDKLIYIHFEGVMAYSRVYLNGDFLGEHKGGYTPFDIRIDRAYRFDALTNMLTVVVDSTELEQIPPFGAQIDYLTYGGIYREVSLGIYDDVFIKNIKVETEHVLNAEKMVRAKVFLANPNGVEGRGCCQITIREKDGKEIFAKSFSVEIDQENHVYDFVLDSLKNLRLWSIDDPNLYELVVRIDICGSCDEYVDRFGFRKAEFKADGFYLNGERLKIIGLNRHQSYPYVGYAMPKRVQEKDAEILKNELHVNMVRTSHYPQSKHFLSKCDELGLLVFEELPGWQHIGNAKWKEVAKENLREMIERDWNHPSIVLWGVRINESPDDDEFYMQTNQIARQLDPTRQTGGVRCITRSNLLEDVYTFNDFIHDGFQGPLRNQHEVTGLDHKVPYLVTEFNGHMYPTKRFDPEERQMEHALRHLRVLNASGLDDSIAGVIGWCAFDYQTHKEFGSGDRICYHGVMDMFRLPKFASHVYRSQISPEVEPVLEPMTFWARGERSVGGVIPLVICTNCDYIRFKFGNEELVEKIYPRKDEYMGVPYPPIIIDFSVISLETVDSLGLTWEDAIITGYYKDKAVIEKRFAKNPIPVELFVAADDVVLDHSQKDATRIVVTILDQCGNLLPFIDDIIRLQLSGPGRLQGPSEVVVKGGAIAFWIETMNEAGTIDVIVRSQRLGEKSVKIEIR